MTEVQKLSAKLASIGQQLEDIQGDMGDVQFELDELQLLREQIYDIKDALGVEQRMPVTRLAQVAQDYREALVAIVTGDETSTVAGAMAIADAALIAASRQREVPA